MKRRYATNKYASSDIIRVDDSKLNGYVCKLVFNENTKPLIVFNGKEDVCIRDKGYTMYEIYRDNSNYALTIMYDDKGKLIEWYFDVAKQIGLEDGIPYEDDLYLDVVITPNGKYMVLDEDELIEAKNNKFITEKDVQLAYKIKDELIKEYANNIGYLKDLTKHIINKTNQDVSE